MATISLPALAKDGPKARALFDRLSVVVLLAVAGVVLATFRDYGLGWDDYTHSQYGDLLVSLYGSGFTDRRVFSFVNLYMYGGGFDLLAALIAKVLPFGLFETRRLVGADPKLPPSTEASYLTPWPAGKAEKQFLTRFNALLA